MTYNLTEAELLEWASKQREICYDRWVNMPEWDDDTPNERMERGVSHILNAPLPPLPKKVGWVSAETKPEYNVGVLVFIPDEDFHITSGMWDISNKWVLLDEYRIPDCEVTHWMPIPEIPKEYQKEQDENNAVMGFLSKHKDIIPERYKAPLPKKEDMQLVIGDNEIRDEERRLLQEANRIREKYGMPLHNIEQNLEGSDTTESDSSNATSKACCDTPLGVRDIIEQTKFHLNKAVDAFQSSSFDMGIMFIENAQILLNQAAPTPEPMAPKDPVIDSLRDKFFSECVSEELFHDHDPLQRIHFELTYRPDEIFEWFKPYLKPNAEPSIEHPTKILLARLSDKDKSLSEFYDLQDRFRQGFMMAEGMVNKWALEYTKPANSESKGEPMIDWEGLTQDLNQFYNEAWNDGVESSAVYEKATVHIPEERISQFLNRLPNYLKPGNSEPTADSCDSNQDSLT